MYTLGTRNYYTVDKNSRHFKIIHLDFYCFLFLKEIDCNKFVVEMFVFTCFLVNILVTCFLKDNDPMV